MRKAVISGGTGFVGRFIVEEFLDQDYDVTVLGRESHRAGYFSAPVKFIQAELGQNFDYQPILDGAHCFVHAALDRQSHKKTFAFKNLGGTAALFKQAKAARVERVVFLSDQAVYGNAEPGMELYEDDPVNPLTVHAKVKREAERFLQAMNNDQFHTASLRLAKVYGPWKSDKPHEWKNLFQKYLTGQSLSPWTGSIIHGEDVARAVLAMVECKARHMSGGIFNVSDMVVDLRDILTPLQVASGCIYDLPEMASRDQLWTMNCDKMKNFEWRTGGVVKLSMTLERMIKQYMEVL